MEEPKFNPTLPAYQPPVLPGINDCHNVGGLADRGVSGPDRQIINVVGLGKPFHQQEVLNRARSEELAQWAAEALAKRVDELVGAGLDQVAAYAKALVEYREGKLIAAFGRQIEEIDLRERVALLEKQVEQDRQKYELAIAKLSEANAHLLERLEKLERKGEK